MGVTLTIRMAPTKAPSAISDVMHTVLLNSNSILPDPTPEVAIKSMDAQAIEFELSFRVRDFSTAAAAKHEVYDLIHRHAKAAELALAQPKEARVAFVGQPAAAPAPAPRPTALRLLDALPLFASLTEEEKAALAATMTRKAYHKDEVLAEQGARLDSLMVIRSGVVGVSRREHDQDVEITRLAPGDYSASGLFTGAGEAVLLPRRVSRVHDRSARLSVANDMVITGSPTTCSAPRHHSLLVRGAPRSAGTAESTQSQASPRRFWHPPAFRCAAARSEFRLYRAAGMTYLTDHDPESALAPLQAAACTYRTRLKHPSLDWPATSLLLRRLSRVLPSESIYRFVASLMNCGYSSSRCATSRDSRSRCAWLRWVKKVVKNEDSLPNRPRNCSECSDRSRLSSGFHSGLS